MKDPNLEDFRKAIEQLSADETLIVNWEHLKPIKIFEDTEFEYHAEYKDDYGNYSFVIKKIGKVFEIISSGKKVYSGSDKEYIKWNFENQLGKTIPKVLK